MTTEPTVEDAICIITAAIHPDRKQPLSPNKEDLKIGDIVVSWNAFKRKFSIFGEIVALHLTEPAVLIECPCCGERAWRENKMTFLLE